jgi:hypothetical protein
MFIISHYLILIILSDIKMEVKRSVMEEELAATLRKSLDDLPVYKDLPRLSGRITVEGQFQSLNFSQNSIQICTKISYIVYLCADITSASPELTVREFLCGYAKTIGQDIKTVEPYIWALEKDWYFTLDSSIHLITEEKWKEYGIPDRLIREMKKVFNLDNLFEM